MDPARIHTHELGQVILDNLASGYNCIGITAGTSCKKLLLCSAPPLVVLGILDVRQTMDRHNTARTTGADAQRQTTTQTMIHIDVVTLQFLDHTLPV